MKTFPILGDPIIKALPWDFLAQFENQMVSNHSQSMRRLAERGGLSIEEAFCAIQGHRLTSYTYPGSVRRAILSIVEKWEKEQYPIPPRLSPDGQQYICDFCDKRWSTIKGESHCAPCKLACQQAAIK